MMNKSQIVNIPDYFYRYINQTDDLDYKEVLNNSLVELENAPIEKWKAVGDKVYIVGKWTVKDIVQHLIDMERVFMFRALAFARKDREKITSVDENDYVIQAKAENRTLESLLEEYKLVRKSLIAMFNSFSDEMLLQKGTTSIGEYSVISIAYITAGHQKWHFKIIEERYFPLIDK